MRAPDYIDFGEDGLPGHDDLEPDDEDATCRATVRLPDPHHGRRMSTHDCIEPPGHDGDHTCGKCGLPWR